MGITNQQIQHAETRQLTAAQDSGSPIRLVAGPGTGKSFAIQKRVRWLLDNNVLPDRIFVTSFTRASSRDLKIRILDHCQEQHSNVDQVNVSTLHSLALRTLRAAGRLTYAFDPVVTDNWELKHVLDAEFSMESRSRPGRSRGYTPGRCTEIRRDYEAFCNTGQVGPPNFIQPDPPIRDSERLAYNSFRTPRTLLYACVLPGEIVRECVVHMSAGTLNPASLLNIEHLIVDEYQDLNPIDLEFVDWLINRGVVTWVAGDDDQSIYSFRYASPSGIQLFSERFPQSGNHELRDCFRCTSDVLRTGKSLIGAFPGPDRIPKNLTSLYEDADPPEAGLVYRWRFSDAVQEARAVASSCARLIGSDFPASEIMILVSNTRTQLQALVQALEREKVEFESPRAASFIDMDVGRFILAILRIVSNSNDYIAHRLVLGSLTGVGPGICNQIARTAVLNNLNFRDLFHRPLILSLFQKRQVTALDRAGDICRQVTAWDSDDTLTNRNADITTLIWQIFGQQAIQEWLEEIEHLPQDITLEELRDYLWANTDDERASLLEAVFNRLGIAHPLSGFRPSKVRIMTMHGAKGLSSGIVIIPGLEDHILPGSRRQPYPGLVLEAARLLYVSITRARASCMLSYSERRIVYGKYIRCSASRYNSRLAGPFVSRKVGLTEEEAQQVIQSHNNL